MTTICLLNTEGKIWLAADGRALEGQSILDSGPKWWTGRLADGRAVALAMAGYGINQTVGLRVLRALTSAEGAEDFARHFCHALEGEDYAFTKAEGDWGPLVFDGKGFLVLGTQAFRMDCAFCMTPLSAGFHAVGSGEDYALGAAFALSDAAPEIILKTALQAAAAHDAGTGQPFEIEVFQP